MKHDDLRAHFPVCEQSHYFQWAYRGTPSRGAEELLRDVLHAHSLEGAAQRPRWFAEYQRVGKLLSETYGRAESLWTYTPNTAFSMGIIANGLDWQAGDEILIPAGEFPSNVYPWMQLERQGVSVRLVVGGNGQPATAADLLESIGDKTRLIAASHVSFHSGYRMDIAALAAGCRERGVISVIDAAQSFGWADLRLDELDADAVTGVGRKFMCGLDGVAFMALSEGLNERLRITSPGPFSVKHESDYLRHGMDWLPEARRFAGGGIASLPVFALGASLELFGQHGGPQAIESRTLELAGKLRRRLQEIGVECLGNDWSEEEQSAVIKVLAEGDDLDERLKAAGVSVSVRPGGLRAAVHAMNSEGDIDALVAALA